MPSSRAMRRRVASSTARPCQAASPACASRNTASASSELYSVLKRPDEKAVTERAYDNPVFVEDLVRNIAVKAGKHPQIKWFRVEAVNYESIHNHNAWAIVERDLSQA